MRRKLQVEIDEERAGFVREKDVTFREWSNTFKEIAQQRIDLGAMKPRTLEGYVETIDLYGLPTLGSKLLRRIGPSDLRSFFEATTKTLDGSESSTASRIRHLKHLSCLVGRGR